MEKESGRFPSWQPERASSTDGGSKPESDKKKKPDTTRRQRTRKALADMLVEPRAEAKNKSAERARQREPAEPAPPAEEPGKRGDVEWPQARESEASVPRPERNKLRPGELFGGEVIIDLQGDVPLAEREIPLHEMLAEKTRAQAANESEPKSEPEPEAELKPEPVPGTRHAPDAPVEVPHGGAEPGPAEEQPLEPSLDLLVPPLHHQPEQAQPAHVSEVPSPEGFVPTGQPGGAETPAGSAPEGEPAAEAAVGPVTHMTVLAHEASLRPEPAEAYRMYMQRASHGSARGVSSGESMVTKQEADDAVYYATRSAQNRGVAAGFLFAALWARHRGKKLRRQFNKRFGEQAKELKKTREDQRFYTAEQAKRQAETDRKLTAAEQRYTYAEKQLATKSRQDVLSLAIAHAEARRATTKESRPPVAGPETVAATQKERPVQQSAQNAHEQLQVPSDHRLERSAWLTTEVDRRTGRAVEQRSFAYGDEYHRERSHENGLAAQRSVIAGGVALAGAAASGSRSNSGGAGSNSAGSGSGSSTVPPVVPDASTQGPPPGSPAEKAQDARKNLAKAAKGGPIWPLALALLVILAVLIVLLH